MHRIIALVGPTAVGKTAVSIELAQSFNAEIVSCDSIQIYRHMQVLSQAPTAAQQRGVTHHLIDCIEPTQLFNVGEYRRIAGPIVNRILDSEKSVVITGGTGLYLKALTEQFCDAPPGDDAIREELWNICQGDGSSILYDRLRGVDAVAAERIHPNDSRRIIRALEVYTLTGKPISEWWDQPSERLFDEPVLLIGLNRDRGELYRRSDARVLDMVYEQCVIDEVRKLQKIPLSYTARQIQGLRDLEAHLSGEQSLKETIATWQQRARHYARRQLIWFRGTQNMNWINIPEKEASWQTATRIAEFMKSAQFEEKLAVGS